MDSPSCDRTSAKCPPECRNQIRPECILFAPKVLFFVVFYLKIGKARCRQREIASSRRSCGIWLLTSDHCRTREVRSDHNMQQAHTTACENC